jgi:CRP/FNR family cyclic AMP-dependent transcriptional regulator
MPHDLLHLSEFFRSVSGSSDQPVGDYIFYFIPIVAFAEALTSIGAAYMKRMIPLRTMAMLNNLLGVMVGVGVGNFATILKHLVNFPLNAVRLREMRRLVANVRNASAGDLKIEWLKSFMHSRSLRAGSWLYSKGGAAREAFLLIEGRIQIPERSVSLEPGAFFGEMALFTAAGTRTASALCATDVRLLVITYEQFEQLYFQNPEFGLYLVRLIVRRFEINHVEPATVL